MGRQTVIGLEEQLEVDKLHDRELAANKSGEFDLLYNQVKNDQDVAETVKKEAAEGGSDDDISADGGDDSLDADPDAGEEGDDSLEDQEPDPEAVEATESIKNLTYSPEMIGAAVTAATDLAVILGTIGIQYSAHAIKNIFKGVVYVFARIARLIYTSTFMLKKYMERRANSFDNLKNSIADLKKTLADIQEKSEAVDPDKLAQDKYSSAVIINTLKIGESTNFSDNINQLKSFLETTVKGMSTQINNETSAIQHIISTARNGVGKPPNNLMSVRTDGLGLVEAQVEGYESSSEYVVTYRSESPLPGDVMIVGNFPRPGLQDFDEIVKAYNDSSIVLGFDTGAFRKVEAVDYMTIEQLSGFLDNLNALCDTCIEHQKIYQHITQDKSYLKNALKNYFSSLTTMNKKLSVKESFIEYVYLKTMFVDKVYLTSMIDVHDYVSKVIAAGTRYAKSNIEQLA